MPSLVAGFLSCLCVARRGFACLLLLLTTICAGQSALAVGFSSGAPLVTGRYAHTSTLLASGKVLVVGGTASGSAELQSAELFDPATNTWSAAATISTKRGYHTATMLPSGKVLVAGGYTLVGNGVVSNAEVYDPITNSWSPAGNLAAGRLLHTATLLPSGKVLLAGGYGIVGAGQAPIANAELYDPATNSWSPAGAMTSPRTQQSATLLPNGHVLVAGGVGALGSSETYDPASNVWTAAGPLASGRRGHTATLLPNGLVLVTGGDGAGGTRASSERFDWVTRAWSPAASLASARTAHAAALLPSGKLLVAGGQSGAPLGSAELYDPSIDAWTPAGSLSTARSELVATLLPSGRVILSGGHTDAGGSVVSAGVDLFDGSSFGVLAGTALSAGRAAHTATLLHSGKLLVTGGLSSSAGVFSLNSVELRDPTTGSWTTAAPMAHTRRAHTATLAFDGKVIVAGGVGTDGRSVERYDPVANAWTGLPPLSAPRFGHTATLLPSGWILFAGGYVNGVVSSAVEGVDGVGGAPTALASLAVARDLHTATLLPSGKVLVAGGRDSAGTHLQSAEIFDPASNTWTAAHPMNVARSGHAATLLASGRVLVTGGLVPTPLASVEVYDPESDTWANASPLPLGVGDHQTALLPSGDVLAIGGFGTTGYVAQVQRFDPSSQGWSIAATLSQSRIMGTATVLLDGRVAVVGGTIGNELASVEIIDNGLGFSDARRPTLGTLIDPIVPGYSPEALTGTGFTGDSEGSGGNTSTQSATNYPLVQLRRIDNAQVQWLASDAAAPFSATSWHSAEVGAAIPGPQVLTMFVNGIPSIGDVVDVVPVGRASALASSVNPSVAGQSVAFTATISGANPVASGWVSFFADGARIDGCAIVTLNGGQAVCATSALAPGTHTIIATYSGDTNASGAWTGGVGTLTQDVASAGPASIVPSGGTPQSTFCTTAFSQVLEATVLDGTGSPIVGSLVTFQFPATATSAGLFPTMAQTLSVATDAAGKARTPIIVAGVGAGSYAATATVSGAAVTANYALTNVCPVSFTYSILGGSAQSTPINADFPSRLQVLVRDQGIAVPGAVVAFKLHQAIVGGATGSFPGGVDTALVLTQANGVATSPIVTANGVAGAWSASTWDVFAGGYYQHDVTFALTNTGGAPASIVADAGMLQSAVVTTLFGQVLVARVLDGAGNPVAGIAVTFALPTSGASGVFEPSGLTTESVVTDVAGHATSPSIRANNYVGPYTATASISGVGSAGFALTNMAGGLAAIEVLSGSPQGAIASTPFAVPVVVRANDAGGNPVAGVDVEVIAPTTGAAALVAPVTATTGADGRAQFALAANDSAGAYALVARSGSIQRRLPMLNVLGPARMELGDAHSCMVTDAATVKCWGRNVEGQLGRGATSASEIPGDVPGLNGVAAVASGSTFSCALLGDGTVACWGDNAFGQLGQGAAGGVVATAAPVVGLTGAVAVAAGSDFACALDNAGAIRCWGRNHVGQTGTGAATVGANLVVPTAVPELASSVAGITAGGYRACAIMVGGNVKCWGGNAAGALGLGTAGGNEPSPRDVTGVSEVVALGMGGEHSCVITSAGTLKCWGNNFSGQVGVLPVGSEVHTPVDVPDLVDDLVAVHLGSSFTCVLARAGYVKCWGANDRGQLGSGVASAPRAAKQPPIGLTQGVISLATGFDHACARLATGGTRCWGADSERQAAGMGSDTLVPTLARHLPGSPNYVLAFGAPRQSTQTLTAFAQPLLVRVMDSFHNPVQGVLVTFTAGGTLANAFLTAQDGGGADQSVGDLTDAQGYASVTAVANEFPGTYSVETSVQGVDAQLGTMQWELTNLGGPAEIRVVAGGFQSTRVGTPFAKPMRVKVVDSGGNAVPGVQVTLTAPATGASAGLSASLLTTDANGEAVVTATANGTAGAFAITVTAAGLPQLHVGMLNQLGASAQVAAGGAHTCAVAPNDTVRCWGHNGEGQVGDGTQVMRLLPTSVPGVGSGPLRIFADVYSSCVLDGTGQGRCWGADDHGELGDGGGAPRRLSPVPIMTVPVPVDSLSMGASHVCATDQAGGLHCWGYNGGGRLGNGTSTSSTQAVDVTGLQSDVSATDAGDAQTCAVTGDGRTLCWGENAGGELGDGTTTWRSVPTEVLLPRGSTVAVGAGYDRFACAIRAGGGVSCWGRNSVGTLGDGTRIDRLSPVNVVGLTDVSQIALGSVHACALTAAGAVKCWGQNYYGSLGDGTNVDRLTPVDVVGLQSGVSWISAGAAHTCAALATGAIRCWGDNRWGQLGDGTQVTPLTPVYVQGFAGSPAAISAANGSGQSAPANTDFAVGLQALVTDAGGNAVQGVAVTFTLPASGAGGTFGGQATANVLTNAAGIATAPTLQANTTLGTWTATATVGGVATPASFALTNLAGPPANLVASSGSGQTTLTSTVFPSVLEATVTDTWGNAVPGANVTFTLPPSGATGNFPGGVKTLVVATNASGVAATSLTANATAGSFNAQAAVAGLTPVTYALTSLPRTGTTITAVSGDGQTATVGSAFAQPLVAIVRDGGGNPQVGLTVTFTLPGGTVSGTFPGSVRTVTRVTDATGAATSPAITATTRSGVFVARASVVGVSPSANFSLTNAPGAPATITARVGGQSTAVYSTFARAPAVRVADAYNNPVPGEPVTFTLPTTGATGAFQGAASPTVVATDATGIATAPLVDANAIVGTYQATATVASIATPATFQFTNIVGSGATFAIVAGTPQSVVVASVLEPLTVAVRDAGDRPVEGVRITFTLPGSAASATFAGGVRTDTQYTDSAGRATSGTPTTTTRSGAFTATARATGIATVLSFSLTNRPDVPVSAAANGVGGQSVAVFQQYAKAPSVRVRDQYGNGVPGVGVQFTLPATGASGAFADASISPLTVATDATGIASSPAVVANGTVGVWYVDAVAGAISPAVRFRMNNLIAPTARIVAVDSSTPQSTTRGTLFGSPLIAVVEDDQGRAIGGVNVTFTLPTGAASARFGPAFTSRTATVATNASGGATSPDVKATATAGSYAATATAAGVPGSATFALTNN